MLRIEPRGLLNGLSTIELNAANPSGDPCRDDEAGVEADATIDLSLGKLNLVPVLDVDATVLHSNTEGDKQGVADVGVTALTINVLNTVKIQASILTAEATAGPCPSVGLQSESSVLGVSATVAGAGVAVIGGGGHFEIDLNGLGLGILTLHLNETIDGGNKVTQRALWIESDLIGDVIVAEAIADVHGNPCGKAPRLKAGFMTGGGTINGNVHHGGHLMCNKDAGHSSLEVNWGGGNRFHLTNVTSSTCSGDGAAAGNPKATFNKIVGSGIGRCNGRDGSATWTLVDNGEPGVNDTFTITVTGENGCTLHSSGTLQHGNHQAHSQA